MRWVLANKGGRTSHAAVAARQMNKVCIVGCRAITINFKERSCTIDKNVLAEGNYITLDGNTGAVYDGKVDVIVEKPTSLIKVIEGWNKIVRPLRFELHLMLPLLNFYFFHIYLVS